MDQNSDDITTISYLKTIIKKFVSGRDWEKYHTPKNLAESVSIEAVELLELFQWRDDEDIESLLNNPEYLKEIKDELADVLIYCISLANRLNIDITKSVLNKMEKK